MKKLCIFLILILIFEPSNAMEVKNPEEFNLDKWITQHRLDEKNRPYAKKIDLSPQQAQKLTDCMQSELSNKSQKEKDKAIKKICQLHGDCNYKYRKALISGAVLAGAQTNNPRYNQPLHDAAYFNDLEFARLLLKYGANPNGSFNRISGEILFLAQSAEMAQLLIDHGAIPATALDELGNNLLRPVILYSKPLELLSLYLRHGVDPNPYNLLHILVNKVGSCDIENILKAARVHLEHGALTTIKKAKIHTSAQDAFACAKAIELNSGTNFVESDKKKKNYIMLGKLIYCFPFERSMKDQTTYAALLPKKVHDQIFEYVGDCAYRETNAKPPQKVYYDEYCW